MKVRKVLSILGLGLALIFSAASAGFADDRDSKTLNITLGDTGADGDGLSISISGAWVRTLAEKITGGGMECDGDLEEGTEKMLRHLERRGPGSRFTLREYDQTIRAKRLRDSVEMAIEKKDGTDARIVMPWGLAECMLGNPDAFESSAADGKLALQVEDEGLLSISIE